MLLSMGGLKGIQR